MSKRRKAAVIITILLILLESIAIFMSINRQGTAALVPYTRNSNFLLMVCSIIYLCLAIEHKDEPDYKMPHFVCLIRFITTSMVTLTFFIVMFLFLPIASFRYPEEVVPLFTEANFFQHVLCPLLAMLSFVLFEDDPVPVRRDRLISVIPTDVYALIVCGLNIVRIVKGPYPFFYVYEQPVLVTVLWFFAFTIAAYMLGLLLSVCRSAVQKRRSKKAVPGKI